MLQTIIFIFVYYIIRRLIILQDTLYRNSSRDFNVCEEHKAESLDISLNVMRYRVFSKYEQTLNT